LFFALHRDYFIVTRNFSNIYRDLVPLRQFTVTRNISAIYRDWQKTRHRYPSLALLAGSDDNLIIVRLRSQTAGPFAATLTEIQPVFLSDSGNISTSYCCIPENRQIPEKYHFFRDFYSGFAR
jgi:hypothetical protein